MRDDRQVSAWYELDDEPNFPNLLNDEDFVCYYWTLPICNL